MVVDVPLSLCSGTMYIYPTDTGTEVMNFRTLVVDALMNLKAVASCGHSLNGCVNLSMLCV